MVSPLFRTENETRQPLGRAANFTYTFAAGTAADVLTLTGYMSEGNKISFVVDIGDLYVAFDATASITAGGDGIVRSTLVPAGQGYSEENIFLSSRISAIPAVSTERPRIRGVVWGR